MKIFEIMCDRNRVHCGPGKEVSLPHLQEMRGGISPPYQWESKADFKVTHLHQWLYLQSNALQLFLQITLLQNEKVRSWQNVDFLFLHRHRWFYLILSSNSATAIYFESFQIHPAPQELWSDCLFSGEKGMDFTFLLVFSFWGIRSSQGIDV